MEIEVTAAASAERAKVARCLEERKFGTVSPFEILAIVDRYGGVEKTRALARQSAAAAREPLVALPESEAREARVLAAETLVERAS